MKRIFVLTFALTFLVCGGFAFAEEAISPPRDDSGIIGGRHGEAWRVGIFSDLWIGGVEYAWPAADGAAGFHLETDGSGTLSWGASGSPTLDTVGDPAADVTFTYADNETDVRTFADTNEDMFNIQGIGAFGDVSVVRIEQKTGAATDGTVLEVVSADADVDGLVVSVNGVANAFVVDQDAAVTIAGVATGTDALTLTAGDITLTDGDLTLDTGDLTVAGTFYQSAIAPAAGGLTINANGAGTVSVGNVSTGAIILTGGGVDIGDGATDTLTITGIVDSDVTLDDGTTDSPKMIFKDSDDEQAEIYQDQASDDLEVECHDASDALAVVVGNLSSGTPNVDVISMNGGDLFVSDDAEIDGTLVVDTDLDVNGTANISGATTQGGVLTLGANGLTLDGAANNIFEWNESTEDLLWTFGATSIDLSSGSGIIQFDFFDNEANALFTHATDGAADDLLFTLTGATDSTLRVTSSGTGADAMVISTSAGGMDITVAGAAANEDIDISTNTSINLTASAETVADQVKVSAVGAIAGNAINVTTTNGGIIVDANGANGDVDIDGASSVDILSAAAVKLAGGGTVQIDSSDWDVSTTGVATNMASIGFDSATAIYHDTVEISNAELKDLVANPKELVATPGANFFLELVSAVLIMDYGSNVLTEAGDNLVIQYGTSNADATATIETTGFIDQAVDQVAIIMAATIPTDAASDIVNNKLELFNDNVDFAGNAGVDTTMTVKVAYRIHADGL